MYFGLFVVGTLGSCGGCCGFVIGTSLGIVVVVTTLGSFGVVSVAGSMIGVASMAGIIVCVCFLKMSANCWSAVICWSPSAEVVGVFVVSFIACASWFAAMMALSAVVICGMWTCVGKKVTVSEMRTLCVVGLYTV